MNTDGASRSPSAWDALYREYADGDPFGATDATSVMVEPKGRNRMIMVRLAETPAWDTRPPIPHWPRCPQPKATEIPPPADAGLWRYVCPHCHVDVPSAIRRTHMEPQDVPEPRVTTLPPDKGWIPEGPRVPRRPKPSAYPVRHGGRAA